MRNRKPIELKESNLIYGKIPLNWNLVRIEHVTNYIKNIANTESFNDEKVFHYSIPNIQDYGRAILEKGGEISSSKFLLSGDEILISKLNPRKKTIVEVSKHDTQKAICSTEFLPFRVKSIDKRYFYYTLLSTDVTDFICARVQSVTRSHQRANPSDITKLLIPVPKKSEQKAIATFLDHKTQAIDQLIEKKQQLIEKLKEKRQALITRAVTKGLNPDAPMKDSGIEWLGEIPEHWVKTKLKWVSNRITTGKTPPSDKKEYYSDDGISWYSPGDFNNDLILSESNRYISQLAVKELGLKLFKPNSVLLVGIGATVGKIGITDRISFSNQQINCIEFNPNKVTPDFGLYQISALKSYIVSLATANTLPIFNQSDTKDLFFFKPPIKEQQIILVKIDKHTNKTFQSINKIAEQVDLLKEYRQSLISEAVTGKIDVRDEVEVLIE